jgi:hypothetical protein
VTKIPAFMMQKFAFAFYMFQLCRKRKAMKQTDYERVLAGIAGCRPVLGSRVEFSLLCMHEGVDMRTVEARIYDEFGVSADELIDIFHASTIVIAI